MKEQAETKIWKYLDLAKFLALLTTESLYFASPSRLQDPFEGSLPKSHVDAISQMVQTRQVDPMLALRTHFAALSAQALDQFDRAMFGLSEGFKDAQREATMRFGVNCWHRCEYESEAMWKLYSASGQAVAIESTIGQLRASLGSREGIIIESVRYADFENDPIEKGHRHYGLFMKRRSFEHEKELRATILLPEEQWSLPEKERGISVACDLNVLINRVLVSPLCEPYVAEAVEKVCSSKIKKLDKPIRRSTLLDAGIFNISIKITGDE
jgi:hypothetical protein